MDLTIVWSKPIRLHSAKMEGLIYGIRELESIPTTLGVYVFGRRKGKDLIPIYIGQATRLRSRIRRQLNNARLMMALQNSPSRGRFVWFAEIQSKPGQKAASALDIVEKALIDSALVDGFEIINIQGTVQRHHKITSVGNREARHWLPQRIYAKILKLRRLTNR